MYIHFGKSINMYVQCMYMVHTCLYIWRYKHVCTSFRRVCTCFDNYKHILLFINMYIPCLNLYIPVCTADVGCTDGYVHYMKCTDILELCTYTDVPFWFQLFDLPCWLACRQGLAAARCHAYSSSSTLV